MPSEKVKNKVQIPLSDKNYLEQIGYTSKSKRKERRHKLEKGIKQFGYKPIVLRLNAMAIRFKNIHPEITAHVREDMAWLKLKHRS